MPSAQNKIQIVDTHETSETLAVTRLQRVGYQINRTLLIPKETQADESRFEALCMLLSLEAWIRLRREQGLSFNSAMVAVQVALKALAP
jgi:hypothetical protein